MKPDRSWYSTTGVGVARVGTGEGVSVAVIVGVKVGSGVEDGIEVDVLEGIN
jgi:hypothetical protein